MKLPKVVFPIFEQAVASGFTFCLFLAGARLLAQPALELYTTLFSLNQSFSFFLFALVLLPVATSTGEDSGKQLGISIVLLGGLLLGFALASPLAMHFFASVKGRITFQLWLLSLGFFSSQCVYEAARWLTIRLKGARTAFAITITRFVLFFAGILLVGENRLDATTFTLAHIAVNIMAMTGFAYTLRGVFHEVHLALPDRRAIKHLANLSTSIANFTTNFATVALVDYGFGGTGLAAFQAIRSATNPIGLLSQVIDNHFSADLARTGRTFTGFGRAMHYVIPASALIISLAMIFGNKIVYLLFGKEFTVYWFLFPLLLLASLTHALTRPIFVNWRLTGDNRAQGIYSLLVICVLLPLLVFFGKIGWTRVMISLFALLPAAALVVIPLRTLHHIRKRINEG